MLMSLFNMFIFPGLVFLVVCGLLAEYVDRKIYARLQNRIGPPWFQPFADFVKLIAKEDIIPEHASSAIFKMMPVLALTAVVTAFFYIPTMAGKALFFFQGDIVVVMYLLTIPTLTYFLGGWYSASLYSGIGAVRSVTQLFAYEVPLFLSILAPALLANTWCLSEMAAFYSQRPLLWLVNLFGFAISLVALLGKLEKVPFDIPEAETEIVAGSFTEYSGRLFGLFRLAMDVELVVGSALLASVFLPFGSGVSGVFGFIIFILKILCIVSILALLRTVFARLRIDQMMEFCWKYMAPLAFLQVIVNLILKGVVR